MVRSKLWDAQDELYALLDAASALNGVQVTLGRPTKEDTDSVWVSGEVSDWLAEYQVSGLAAKDETFSLRVGILCVRLGTEYVKVRNAVKALGEAVEDVVAANPTLGGTVMLAQIRNARVEETLTDERHRAVQLSIDVECRAWLDS